MRLTASAAKPTRPDPTTTPSPRLQTDLKGRIDSLLLSVQREDLLPMGVRSLIAEEGRELRRLAERPICNLLNIAQTVHAIAHHLHTMGPSVHRSETLAHLRGLNLEIESDLNATQSSNRLALSDSGADASTHDPFSAPLEASIRNPEYASA